MESCVIFLEFRTSDDVQTDKSNDQYAFNGVLCTSNKCACALACTYVLTTIMEGMYSTYIHTQHQISHFYLISFPPISRCLFRVAVNSVQENNGNYWDERVEYCEYTGDHPATLIWLQFLICPFLLFNMKWYRCTSWTACSVPTTSYSTLHKAVWCCIKSFCFSLRKSSCDFIIILFKAKLNFNQHTTPQHYITLH